MSTEIRRSPHAIREELSALLRQAYIDERKNWHRGRGGEVENYRPSNKWNDVWPRMADFFLKHQIENYRAFIHVQFTKHGNLSCCPTPKACYGPAALRRWEKYKPNKRTIEMALRLQSIKLQEELQKYTNWQKDWTQRQVETMVLYDHDNGLTALFRYCGAVKIERDDIADVYHYAALLQYLFGQEIYNEVWGDLIPQSLKDEARRLRFSMLEQTE